MVVCSLRYQVLVQQFQQSIERNNTINDRTIDYACSLVRHHIVFFASA
jgi:hypothetical protein